MTFKEYIIEKKFPDKKGIDFEPKKELYIMLGINQKRLGLILKGELVPDIIEAVRIADLWKLTAEEVFFYYKNYSSHYFNK